MFYKYVNNVLTKSRMFFIELKYLFNYTKFLTIKIIALKIVLIILSA